MLVFCVDVCLDWCLSQLWVVAVWSMLGDDGMLIGTSKFVLTWCIAEWCRQDCSTRVVCGLTFVLGQKVQGSL
jgi:hypothetical protein